ncbi:centrosome-associated zinc finger protein CP190 isoform X2 [Condylostylus longicornis]|uniref:centrosome-associated zinc finger protein CP190 isoform X2 n=1 Tax=Condylostylus longicornis TaxID=2530218 RepID=UPI00244DF53E|nr:centrosome-associated zinc finger protein CP190 isoform X2 [Condylostylus longicornis]
MKSKKLENMGEIKSVKVDNWGVFFLQKLQNFFNKTDYCDLTLQFNDNSQLKVHRLVLNACTDYFNVLEQTCEMIDDVLIMPNELQADLVVPIVNFMYTGTLEFELKIYGKLLKTARDMNMTVLLKLLEAHRRTMETKPKNQKPAKTSSFQQMKTAMPSITKPSQQKSTNRPVLVKGPTRFEYEAGESLTSFDPTFDNISYESKPLKVDYGEQIGRSETSPFEQLRQTGYNNNKRPAQSLLESPPTKKPNIQDVKEYAEQQRMRKQIAEDYGEEPDFDSILDDEFHNDDDDEEFTSIQENTRPTTSKSTYVQQTSPQKTQASLRKSDSSTQQKPTIVVKECSSSNVDHAKIISEVLRKYPHLIKNNKNIKLKIMPTTSGGGAQKVFIKQEPSEQRSTAPTIKTEPVSPKKMSQAVSTTLIKSESLSPSGKNSQLVAQKPAAVSTSSTPNQPRRIDSKTMKQLIALGAENTTGPWLCLRCGVNGRPISIPSYRGFRRHLVNTHKEKIDPRLCEHCGWRSINQKELVFHMFTQHDVRTSISFPKCEHCGTIVFDMQALDQHIDDVHPEVKEDNQQCIYCNKTFSTELMLYNHMKDQHKERARDDGVIDFSEEDEAYEEYEQKMQNMTDAKSGSKIQILSDIDLPKCISLTQITKPDSHIQFDADNLVEMLGRDSQIMQPTDLIPTISSGMTSEPKFINADGNVMELTPAQRAEIMSQLEQGGDGVVMVLDESFSERVTAKIIDNTDDDASQEGAEQDSDHNIADVNNIAEETTEQVEEQVMEEEAVQDSNEDKQNQTLADDLEEELNAWKPPEISRKENTKIDDPVDKDDLDESNENLDEQLEKLTQMTQPLLETKKVEKVSKDELDERLKMLTNDWTDDEDEEVDNSLTSQSTSNKLEKEKNDGSKKEVKDHSKIGEDNENIEKEENIEDILKGDLEDKPEEQSDSKDDKENEKIESETKEKTPEITSQKDSESADNSLVAQQDSGESDDEEKVLREQPICATEEDTPVEDNTDTDKNIGTITPHNTENQSDGDKDEEKSKTSDIEKNEKSCELLKDEIKFKSEENEHKSEIKEENLEVEIEKDHKTSSSSEESKLKPQTKEKSPESKKEEIKSIINEWDDGNEDDDL